MDLSGLYQRVGAWLDETGPVNDIVISSRVRLARNLAGFFFCGQADEAQQRQVLEFVREKLTATDVQGSLWYVPMEQVTALQRQVLTERHLISRELAETGGPRAVALTPDESLAVMVNEEDHLRIQMMANGLQLRETYERICRVDEQLEGQVEYAFSAEYGYLTACPTNTGTGMRVSVMLHLPALKMTGEIEKVLRAAKDLRLAVRGLYGEGSEPVGDFYQLSNQTALGKTEEQIIDDLTRHAVEPMVEYERRARKKLSEGKATALDDKIFRAKGILSHARMVSSEEALYLLSYIRLGIHLGRFRDVRMSTVNRLFLTAQPAHLQTLFGEDLDAGGRDRARADYIRRELAGAA